MLKLTVVKCAFTEVTFSVRFIDRPDQRISLDDFKSFLLDSQKVTIGKLNRFVRCISLIAHS